MLEVTTSTKLPTTLLTCRDCLDCIHGFRASLILGSPPYALKGERYLGKPLKWDVIPWVEWMLKVIEASLDAAPVCAFVVNDPVREGEHHPAVDGLKWMAWKKGFVAERPLIWHKNATPNRRDWFSNDWERVVVFKRSQGPVPIFNASAIGTAPKYTSGGDFRQRDSKGKRRKGSKYPQNKTTIPRDVLRATIGGGHMGHPLAHDNEAPYPESLIIPIIKALTNEGDTVLDPFCGSGTTCAVAKKLNRGYIGIDNRESQIELTRRRLQEVKWGELL